VILCTHLLGDVERLCEQVVVLDRGTVVQSGAMRALRTQVGNQYELRWQGPGERFLAALAGEGVKVAGNASQRVIACVPAQWSMARFFQLATECGVVIDHLKADEETLERLFFRVTTDT
jgi:ABC-2 type transport system ATP-binding protein